MPKPTFADIASHAGVGTATVERVLNGRGGVRPATVEKVIAAARALDYPRRLPEVHRGLLRIEAVLVRPENVRIGDSAQVPGANGSGIAWAGRVKHLTFRGPRVSLAVETPAQKLNVESQALLPVREGDALILFVPTHGAWAIRPAAPRA